MDQKHAIGALGALAQETRLALLAPSENPLTRR
jgi:hypothetical protein